jgi:hypothetical protein
MPGTVFILRENSAAELMLQWRVGNFRLPLSCANGTHGLCLLLQLWDV